jgi:hypothetical protein
MHMLLGPPPDPVSDTSDTHHSIIAIIFFLYSNHRILRARLAFRLGRHNQVSNNL